MKAAVVIGYNDIRYSDVPDPQILSGHIKVAVKYCGICGSDVPRVLKGACHSYPQILGHEFSGVVIEVANDVRTVKVGDHVVGVPLVPCMECEDCRKGNFSLCKNYSFIGSRQQGAMAQYIVLHERNVVKIDKNIPLEFASLFEPATVALHALLITNYKPNPIDKVCVIGAGVIALFTLQWCKILGAKDVTVIGRSYDGLDLAKKFGATQVISTLDEDYLHQIDNITENKGFNYIFDAAGTNKTIPLTLQIASSKARICYVGTPTDRIEFDVKQWELLNRKELYLTGSWMSYSAPWPGKEWELTALNMANNTLVLNHDLIHVCRPLNQVEDVFKLFNNVNSRISGRIILEID